MVTNVKYVAHRGYSMREPENTIPAFELAGQHSFWGIECDTYCTVDGRWIVHHDRTVDRMTNGTGDVKNFTYAQICELTIDSGANIERRPGLKIPPLEDVLAVCKQYGLHAFVEIEKYHHDTDLQTLVKLLENSGMKERCSFICFNADDLRKVRELDPNIPLGFLRSKPSVPADIAFVQSIAPSFLNYDYRATSAEDIVTCHQAGIEASVWTVNTPEEATPFVHAGIDYITTDTKLF